MGTQLLVRGGVATVATRSRDTGCEPQWGPRLIRFMAGLLEFGVRPKLADRAGMLRPPSVRSGTLNLCCRWDGLRNVADRVWVRSVAWVVALLAVDQGRYSSQEW